MMTMTMKITIQAIIAAVAVVAGGATAAYSPQIQGSIYHATSFASVCVHSTGTSSLGRRRHGLRAAPPSRHFALKESNLPQPREERLRALSSFVSSSDIGGSTTPSTATAARIDRILSKLTNMFPLFVLGSAILGLYAPGSLNWVNNGNIISIMLAGVMLGTGMTLERADFTDIMKSRTQRSSIPIGVLCQFALMPLSASIVGRTLLLPCHDPQSQHAGKHVFLGLVLVGCSPGGTASNLVSLIAGADVALSVLLTACSTVLASAVTPALTKLIVGNAIPVSGAALCAACARVVLGPVVLGVALNECAPGLCKWVSRWTPFSSVLLVSLICGGVVANNSSIWIGGALSHDGALSLPALVLLSVILTHALGFAMGYLVPRRLFALPEKTARTISIETGMQNSALAVVLARSVGADPLSYLPGALSATAHSCLGSGLAALWRLSGREREEDESGR